MQIPRLFLLLAVLNDEERKYVLSLSKKTLSKQQYDYLHHLISCGRDTTKMVKAERSWQLRKKLSTSSIRWIRNQVRKAVEGFIIEHLAQEWQVSGKLDINWLSLLLFPRTEIGDFFIATPSWEESFYWWNVPPGERYNTAVIQLLQKGVASPHTFPQLLKMAQSDIAAALASAYSCFLLENQPPFLPLSIQEAQQKNILWQVFLTALSALSAPFTSGHIVRLYIQWARCLALLHYYEAFNRLIHHFITLITLLQTSFEKDFLLKNQRFYLRLLNVLFETGLRKSLGLETKNYEAIQSLLPIALEVFNDTHRFFLYSDIAWWWIMQGELQRSQVYSKVLKEHLALCTAAVQWRYQMVSFWQALQQNALGKAKQQLKQMENAIEKHLHPFLRYIAAFLIALLTKDEESLQTIGRNAYHWARRHRGILPIARWMRNFAQHPQSLQKAYHTLVDLYQKQPLLLNIEVYFPILPCLESLYKKVPLYKVMNTFESPFNHNEIERALKSQLTFSLPPQWLKPLKHFIEHLTTIADKRE